MTRLLVLLALLVVAWVGVQRLLVSFLRSPQGRQIHALWRLFSGVGATPGARRDPEAAGRRGRTQGEATPARLVRCAACNTHVPENRAVRGRGERAFCSKECLAGAERA